MGLSNFASLLASAVLVSTSCAQLTGTLSYDGLNTLAVSIINPTANNYTILARNTLFDRQNSIPYEPVTVTTANGTTVTLNGTAAPPSPTGLSDEEFQPVEPGTAYTRSLLLSNYLPIVRAGLLPIAASSYIAILPTSFLAVDTTGIGSFDTLATYYLSRGLKPVTMTSAPLAFNWTFPSVASAGPKRMRRRRAADRQPPLPRLRDISK